MKKKIVIDTCIDCTFCQKIYLKEKRGLYCTNIEGSWPKKIAEIDYKDPFPPIPSWCPLEDIT